MKVLKEKSMSRVCENKVNGISCGRKAVTTRKNWRKGDNLKGEPTLVEEDIPLCKNCAKIWDNLEED
jgi:hypothetical protein